MATSAAPVAAAQPAEDWESDLVLASHASFHIRDTSEQSEFGDDEDAADEDDEQASTIKATGAALVGLPPPKSAAATSAPPPAQTLISADDNDFESDFELGPRTTQTLSLTPLIARQRSRPTLEQERLLWGDSATSPSTNSNSTPTSSSFNTIFHSSPGSSATSTAPESDLSDLSDGEGFLEGIVLPPGFFDAGGKALRARMEAKMREKVGLRSPSEAGEPFESGLVITEDIELSPSRIERGLGAHQKYHHRRRTTTALASASAPHAQHRPRHIRAGTTPALNVVSASPLRTSPALTRKGSATSLRQQQRAPSPAGTTLRPKQSPTHPSKTPSRMQRRGSLSSLTGAPELPASTRSPTNPAARAMLPHHAYTLRPSRSTLHINVNNPHSTNTGTGTSSRRSPSPLLTHSPSTMHPPPSSSSSRPGTPSSASTSAAARLTLPTASSLAKARPPIPVQLAARSPTPTSSPPRTTTRVSGGAKAGPRGSMSPPPIPLPVRGKLLRRPKGASRRVWGDGSELEGIEDLPTTSRGASPVLQTRQPPSSSTTRSKPQQPPPSTGGRRPPSSLAAGPPRASSPAEVPSKRRKPATAPQQRRRPTLIKNLGREGPKVVGEMTYDPLRHRWEGNREDPALRELENALASSARPALITQFTGSSVASWASLGSPTRSSDSGRGGGAIGGGYLGGPSSQAKVVGGMVFDPVRMCWLSNGDDPEDDDDPFADLSDSSSADPPRASSLHRRSFSRETGDDAEEEGKFDTLRAVRKGRGPRDSLAGSEATESDVGEWGGEWEGLLERGLVERAREAEKSHREEVRGWTPRGGLVEDRRYLYDIFQLARRNK